jgi:hypothetical protein
MLISTRLNNVLKQEQCQTIYDIINRHYRPTWQYTIPNMGKTTFNELELVLEQQGLKLKPYMQGSKKRMAELEQEFHEVKRVVKDIWDSVLQIRRDLDRLIINLEMGYAPTTRSADDGGDAPHPR